MKLRSPSLFLCAIFLAVIESCTAQSTMVPWLTRAADNSRSGWNSHETQLTQASVLSKGIVRATVIPVAGDARGMEAQPLILPNVQTTRGTRDVLVLPSMANVVGESMLMTARAYGKSRWVHQSMGREISIFTSSTNIGAASRRESLTQILNAVSDLLGLARQIGQPSNSPLLHVCVERWGRNSGCSACADRRQEWDPRL